MGRSTATTIDMYPENATKVILATIALHNFIKLNDSANKYSPKSFSDWEDESNILHYGEWRLGVEPLRSARIGSRNATKHAFHLRNTLKKYFCNEGAISFQYDKIKL